MLRNIMKKQDRFWPIILLVTGLILSGSWAVQAASIPKMDGETLDGIARSYPKDFNGMPTIMLILFDRDQQAQLDGWVAAMDDLPDGVGLVEIALIGKVGGIAKFFIKGGMKDAIENDDARLARMMPYFGDADKVIKRMKITDKSDVMAVLLSPSGKVFWQSSGDYNGQFKSLDLSVIN